MRRRTTREQDAEGTQSLPLILPGRQGAGRQPHMAFCHAVLVGLYLIHFFGEGHIMWGSDYPHPDSTWPFSKEIIEKDTGHLPSETKKKIIHDNAAALYGLS